MEKGSLKRVFLIFFLIEVLFLILSGGLTKKLEIGFADGKFVARHVASHHDLQEEIKADFQPDEFLLESGEPGEIMGSEAIYNFFASVFGEKNAIKSFFLIRILLILDLVLLLIAFMTKKYLFDRPSKPQVLFEMLYSFFEEFVADTIGEDFKHYTPYIVTIFIFIWSANMIGLVPLAAFIEPTRNLNVPIGMGIITILVVHATAIKVKGVWGHFRNYINPIDNPLFLLDIVGELSKVVSISFRLFGNILGGAIIILVVSSLVKYLLFPVGLNLFFGIFVGSIQAFVFTMLALTYIGVEIAE
ncbi:MAG: F0F1 ATP synthase subunit A [Candidatus Cloacimonadales bacterium]